MRKSVTFAGAAVLAVACAQGAHASDWSGAYVGLRSDYVNGATDYPLSPGTPDQDSLDGGFMGVQAGYNVDLGPVVLGARASGEWGNATQTVRDGNYITESGTLSSEYALSLIAGLPLGGVLLYVEAGKSWADLEQQEQCPDPAAVPFGFCRPAAGHAPFNLSESRTVEGDTLGAGVEVHIADKWTVAVEYSKSSYDNETYVLSPDASGHPLPASVAALDEERVGFSLNYHF